MKYPIYNKHINAFTNPVILRGTVKPNPTADHNKISWEKIEPFVDDGLTLGELTDKLGYHGGPIPVPRGFILYCCDLNWLRIKKVAI